MENQEIKAGDVVFLKSSTLRMTVGAITKDGIATCYWEVLEDFNPADIRSAEIHIDALKKKD